MLSHGRIWIFLDFLASAFTNLVALNVAIISFLYTEYYPQSITIVFCKVQSYVMTTSLQMSRFLILTACFDRFALSSSNARLRKFADVHLARHRVLPAIVLIWLFVPMHIPIFLGMENRTCVFPASVEMYNSIYGIVVIGTIPPSLMFLFSILIFRNLKLRQQRRQVHPLVGRSPTQPADGNERLRKKDQQVLAMLLVQVVAYVASSTPYAIALLYVVLRFKSAGNGDSAEDKPTMLFILFITDMLRFVSPFISFYLFVLASRLYRQEMFLTATSAYQRCCSLYKMQHPDQHLSIATRATPRTQPTELEQGPPRVILALNETYRVENPNTSVSRWFTCCFCDTEM